MTTSFRKGPVEKYLHNGAPLRHHCPESLRQAVETLDRFSTIAPKDEKGLPECAEALPFA
jgi:hypothetical protein